MVKHYESVFMILILAMLPGCAPASERFDLTDNLAGDTIDDELDRVAQHPLLGKVQSIWDGTVEASPEKKAKSQETLDRLEARLQEIGEKAARSPNPAPTKERWRKEVQRLQVRVMSARVRY